MSTRFMGYNVAIFVIFFGLALLEAIRDRDLAVVGFWLFVGAVFAYGDAVAYRRKRHG